MLLFQVPSHSHQHLPVATGFAKARTLLVPPLFSYLFARRISAKLSVHTVCEISINAFAMKGERTHLASARSLYDS